MSFFARLDGQPVELAELHVPSVGIWFARVVTVEPWTRVGSTAVLDLGSSSLIGHVERSGQFAGRSTVVIVGGREGWSREMPAQHHHGAVSLSSACLALAAAAGEALTFDASFERSLGVDWVRPAGRGAGLLTHLLAGAPWWVGFDSVTRVGARAGRDVTSSVQVLEHSEDDATLGFVGELGDDILDVMPGCYLVDTERLGPGVRMTIIESRITSSSGGLRAACRVSLDAVPTVEPSRIAGLVAGLAAAADPCRILARGPFRYRVYDQSGDEVRLQVVRKELLERGLPDLIPLRMAPGLAGSKATLAPGCIVLVEFVEGDPSLPVVTHFSSPDDPGFLPVSLAIDATTGITLGDQTGIALRVGDKIRINATANTGAPGPIDGVIILDALVTAPGLPGVGHSKVEL